MKDLNRRNFLRAVSVAGLGTLATSYLKINAEDKKPDEEKPKPVVAVVEGDNPADITVEALNILGGMGKFVKKGNVVVLKPNIAWEQPPELAATTNPEVVSAVIKECFKAGAKKVKIVERACGDSRKCYHASGLDKVVKETGAEIVLLTNNPREYNPKEYKELQIPNAKELPTCLIAKEVTECDVFINIPIAKHHVLSRLTLSIKNLMGVMGDNRGKLHNKIGQKMAEVLQAIYPQLTIIDAYRVLIKNGPTGGNPKDVVLAKKVIISTDAVAADSYAASLAPFGLKGEDIPYVKAAYEMKLGEIDISRMDIIKKKI